MNFKVLKTGRNKKQKALAAAFVLVIAAAWIYPALGFFIVLCMMAGIAIAAARGRKWCDWYCPRGSFLDYYGSKMSPEKRIPGIFRSMPLRLTVLAFLMGTMSFQLSRRWPDPVSIGLFFVMLLTITSAVSLILALSLHQRTWCFVCPVGTISNFAGRWKGMVKIDSELCDDCGSCGRVCPVQIEPTVFKGQGVLPVKDGDCLKCGLCGASCPREALTSPAA